MSSRSLGVLTVDLVAKTAGFQQGMDRAARLADRRSKDISKSIQNGLKGAVGSITAFTTGLIGGLVSAQAAFQGFMNAIDSADRLDELSKRLGITTEQLSAWGYAAKLTGTDLESLTGSLQKFSKNVAEAADAGSNQSRLFESLGINVKDAEGNLRDVEDLLPEVADRFKALNNDTTETALAMELFGRSGSELLEFLNKGSSGLKELGDEARTLGGIIDTETATAAADFNDELDKLRTVTNGLFSQLARELLPSLTDLVRALSDAAKQGQAFGFQISDIGEALRGVIQFFREMYGGVQQSIRALAGLNEYFLAVRNTARDLLSLNFSNFGANLRSAFSGLSQFRSNLSGGADFSDVTSRVQGARASNPRGGSNRPETGLSGLQANVNAFLAGQEKSTKETGRQKKQVDELTESYKRLLESLTQQYEMFGKTTEEARVRYEVENGALQKLDQARKNELITLAQRIDAQERLKDLQDAADDAVRREQEAISEGRKRTDELIADMEFENSLLKLNNDERAKAIALRYADANATDEQRARIAELSDQYQQGARTAELWEDVQRGIGDAITDIVTGSKSAKDAITDFFDALNEQIVRMIADNWAEKLANLFKNSSSSTGEGGGGWIAAIGQLFSSFSARASGGSVTAGMPYLVGERGPELMVPSVSGRVVANSQIGSVGGVTVNQQFINPVLSDRRSESQRQAQAARLLRQATSRNG